MESENKAWFKSFMEAGLSMGGHKSTMFDRAMKSVLPTAAAQTQAPPAPLMPAEPDVEVNSPAMEARRALVGKAFALYIQQNKSTHKYDELSSESKGTSIHFNQILCSLKPIMPCIRRWCCIVEKKKEKEKKQFLFYFFSCTS